MRNIKLTIQYDGTNYNGWQIQPAAISNVRFQISDFKKQKNIITIQGIIQAAIKKITAEDVKLIGAGRTDAGVHAIEQSASFKTTSRLSADIIQRALNANLPDDIRVIEAKDVKIEFHPRYDAKSKIYFYIISNSYFISPFLCRYAWKIAHKLDLDAMRRAIEPLKGRHDFSAFRASGCGAKNSVRTIFDISVGKIEHLDFMSARLSGDFFKIRIEADAFLRHMVRNIAGTIVEAGKGKMKSEDIEGIMLSKDRKNAGAAAPARGLFLEKVNY
jgi:tRNA pseudouridine38-40 synthase